MANRVSGRGWRISAMTAMFGVSISSFASAQAPAPAEPAPTWTGSAGAGMAITGGNSDTMNYNLGFDLTRTPMARNVMKWKGLYLRGDQNDVAVIDKTALSYRDEYTLSGRTFVFGQIDYLRDTFKLIDYLIAPTAGIGYKLVNTEQAHFDLDLGAGSVSEKNPGTDLKTSGAITAGEKLEFQITPTATFKHATTGLWKASDFADSLYTFSIGLATQISPRVQLSVDFLDSYKNRPPDPSTKKNDTALVTAISSKF